jgi:hypothetical protein
LVEHYIIYAGDRCLMVKLLAIKLLHKQN